MVVAVSRHNNPDELLVLCCVAALWFAVRALEDGRTRWLVWCGVCVGLGFETKMAVALLVVPGIALAYLWVAPRGRIAAIRQLVAGGVALAVVGLAWPMLVTLTPAADRPWISGTSDNSIWSLIFNYNGVGRITGQTGAPGTGFGGGGGGGGGTFGGATGVFRLLQSGLGDQAGWLLGFAVVAGLGVLVVTSPAPHRSAHRLADRRRRRVPDHRGRVQLRLGDLPPLLRLVPGPVHGDADRRRRGRGAVRTSRVARIAGPLAIVAGAVTELVVLGNLSASCRGPSRWSSWSRAPAAALASRQLAPRVRAAVIGVALAALLAAPATWAAETIGHATASTFPTGGPASAQNGGFGGSGRPGGPGRGGFGGAGRVAASARPPGSLRAPVARAAPRAAASRACSPIRSRARPGRAAPASGAAASAASAATGGFGGPGGAFGGDTASLNAAIKYAKTHGGGTIGVSSQSSAAAAILSTDANVAGLGGFSGRESSVSARGSRWRSHRPPALARRRRVRWLRGSAATPVRAARPRWTSSSEVGKKVTVTTNGTTITMYDLQGRASAILAAAGRS